MNFEKVSTYKCFSKNSTTKTFEEEKVLRYAVTCYILHFDGYVT